MSDVAIGDGAHPLRGRGEAAPPGGDGRVRLDRRHRHPQRDRPRRLRPEGVLSHVHAGTLGWITTSVFAASLWLFGAGASDGRGAVRPGLTRAVGRRPAGVRADVRLHLRGAAGDHRHRSPLLAILGVFAWVVARARHDRAHDRAPRLPGRRRHVGRRRRDRRAARHRDRHRPRRRSPTAAATPTRRRWSSASSSPSGWRWPSGGCAGSDLEPAGRLGTAQMALPVRRRPAADGRPAARHRRRCRRWPRSSSWPASSSSSSGSGGRSARSRGASARPAATPPASAIAIIANIVFLNYLAGANGGDFDLVGDHQLLALDHMMFVGVLTNAIFALLLVATASRSALAAPRRRRLRRDERRAARLRREPAGRVDVADADRHPGARRVHPRRPPRPDAGPPGSHLAAPVTGRRRRRRAERGAPRPRPGPAGSRR